MPTLPDDMPSDQVIRDTFAQLKSPACPAPSSRAVAMACWPSEATADDHTWDAVLTHIRSIRLQLI